MAKAKGNIDQLNFELILHDEAFNRRIANDKKQANDLNVSLSKLLELKKDIASTSLKGDLKGLGTELKTLSQGMVQARVESSKAAQEVKTISKALAETVLNQNKVTDSAEKEATAHQKAEQNVRSTNAALGSSVNLMRTLTQLTGVYFGAAGIRRFVSSMVEVTGNLEMQREAMNHILGSAEKGEVIFEQLKELAKPSYFTLPELTKYAKQLSALSIPYEELFETTKMLGDVSAGLGVSFDRIALAYGHIRSMGFLRGMQARQLTNAGIPIFEELAKNLSEVEGKMVSISEVYDRMSKRQITFEQVREVFQQMTSEGGKFYDMQIAMTDTLAGRINKLKGVWEITLSEIGNANSGLLKGSVNAAIDLISNYEELGKTIKEVAVGWGIYKVAIIAAELATKTFDLANHKLLQSLANVSKWIATNPYAILAAGLVAATYGIYKFFTALSGVEKIQKSITDSTLKYNTGLASEQSALDALYTKLKLATEGTEEYDAAKKAIQSKYGEYISQLREEGVAVDNLADIYDNLKLKIEESTKARFLESSSKSLEEAYVKATDEVLKRAIKSKQLFGVGKEGSGSALGYYFKSIAGKEVTAAQMVAYEQYLRGLTNVDAIRKSGVAGMDLLADFISGEGVFKSKWADTKKITENYKTQIKEIADAYADGMVDLERLFGSANNRITGGAGEVSPMTTKLADIVDGIKNVTNAADELRKKAKESGLTDEEEKRMTELNAELKTLKEQYELYAGIKYDKEQHQNETSAEKQRKRDIQNTKQEIALLQKYKATYDKLAQNPLIGEENAKALMEQFYGETDLNYVARINAELEKLLNLATNADAEALQNYADGIRAAFGKDAAEEYLKSLTAFDSLEKKITEYLSKDFNVDGEKVAYKISKALTDLFNKNVKVDLNVEQLVKDLENTKVKVQTDYLMDNAELFADAGTSKEDQQALAEAYWEEYKTLRIQELKAQAKQEKDFNEAATRENIRSLVKQIFDEQMQGFDLTNWNDKTLGQISDIREAIQNVKVPDEIKEDLAQIDGLLEAVLNDLNKYKSGYITNTVDPEATKKWAKAAQNAAKFLSRAASSMRELADATGDVSLSELAEVSGAISKNLEAAAAGYQMAESMGAGAYSWIGAIAGGLINIVEQISALVSEEEASVKVLKDMMRDSVYQSFVDTLNERLSPDSIFGENTARSLREATKIIKESKAAMESLVVAGETEGKIYRPVGNYTAPLLFRTRKVSWFMQQFRNDLDGEGYEIAGITQLAEKLGMALYDDKYGILNLDLLKTIRNQFGSLQTDVMSDWLDDTIEAVEGYVKAMETVKDAAEDIFGDIASSAADTIVDQWIEAGNAALDYADILDDVAKAYAKMLIKSAIMDTVFNDEEQEKLINLFMGGDYERAMAEVAAKMGEVEGMAPIVEQILSALDPYFKKGGSSDTFANGIKGFNEDSVNLVASHANAMRADLSLIRSIQVPGWQDVEQIRELLERQDAPNYNEYMAQIAANTYDTARSNQQILSEIQGVIMSSSAGGRALKVEVM